MDFIFNLFIMVGDQLMRFTANLLVARQAGEHLFGDFTAAVQSLILVGTLATLGLDSIISFYFPKLYTKRQYSQISSLYSSFKEFLKPFHLVIFTAGVLLTISLLAFAQASRQLESYEMHHPLYLFIWGITTISLFRILLRLYRSLNYMRTSVILDFSQTLLYFLVAIYLYHNTHMFAEHYSKVYFPHMMLAAFVFSHFIVLIFSILGFRRIIKRIKKPQKNSCSKLVIQHGKRK